MSVLPLLSVILGNQLNTTIKEDEVKNYIKEDPISVSNFIKDNFSAFVNSYNNSDNSDIKWLATEVEKDFEINIILPESSYKGIFLDFDSDNGYSVVGNDYEFISFNIDKESPFKDIVADSYNYYILNDFFTYVIDEVEYNLDGFSNEYIEEQKEELFKNDDKPKKHYDGQEDKLSGSGGINYPNTYMRSRYGSGWVVESSKSLDMNKYSLESLSCYKVKHGDSFFTEGNCWAVAAYNCLQAIEKLQWIHKGVWLDIPAGDKDYRKNVKYFPQDDEPWQYSKYKQRKEGFEVRDKIYSDEWKERLPELWRKMRSILNDNKKYIENGGAPWETSGLVEKAAKAYGEKVNGVEHYNWGAYVGGNGIRQLDNYMPLAWSTSNDTYGSHTMTVCGYKIYKKTNKYSIYIFGKEVAKWTTYEYKLLCEICDGWTKYNPETQTSPSRYYDMNAHVGFSCIITFSYKK